MCRKKSGYDSMTDTGTWRPEREREGEWTRRLKYQLRMGPGGNPPSALHAGVTRNIQMAVTEGPVRVTTAPDAGNVQTKVLHNALAMGCFPPLGLEANDPLPEVSRWQV